MIRAEEIVLIKDDNARFEQYRLNLADYAHLSKGAFSSATERARRSDLNCFSEFCIQQGYTILPATEHSLIHYLEWLDCNKKAPATMHRRLQSIHHLHKAAGVQISPISAQSVKLTLRKIKRRLAQETETRGQGQAKPATYDIILRLLLACDTVLKENISTKQGLENRKTQAAIRDKSLISMAYFSLMRRSELVALNVEDLEIRPQTTKIHIRHSKTDQSGEGAIVSIGNQATECLRAYLNHMGHHKGALFLSLNGRRLCAIDVSRALKRRAQEAGFTATEIKSLSPHSTRIGATIDAVSGGQTILQMQRAGRWKNIHMVSRYAKNVDTEKDALQRESLLQDLYK